MAKFFFFSVGGRQREEEKKKGNVELGGLREQENGVGDGASSMWVCVAGTRVISGCRGLCLQGTEV